MKPIWNPEALDRLADLYVTLSLVNQRLLAVAIEEMDAELESNAQFLGESRSSALTRIWFTDWLQVLFRLIPGGGVEVLFVRDNRRPPR